MATTNNQKELTATYIDAAGNKQTGTVAGQYAQQASQESAAPMNTGVAAATTGATKKSSGDYWGQMADYYQQMYDEQVAANNAANAAAADQARQATKAQIDALAASYADTNRQLYRDYMQNERTLPQQMAAQGYSGGLSESAMLRLRNAYEENLNVNERARSGEENAANAALAQQIFEAQMAADQANQAANQQRLGYLAQLRTSRYDQDQQRLQQRAQALAAAGDYSGYRDLGYSQGQVDYLTRIWLQEHPDMLNTWVKSHKADALRLGLTSTASSGGGGGGSSRGGTKPLNNEEAASMAVTLYMQGQGNGGTSAKAQSDVNKAIDESVKKGELSKAAGDYAKKAVKTEVSAQRSALAANLARQAGPASA